MPLKRCSPQGTLAMSGDSFDGHNSESRSCGGCAILWVEARDAVKHPVMHGTAPHNKISRLKCE